MLGCVAVVSSLRAGSRSGIIRPWVRTGLKFGRFLGLSIANWLALIAVTWLLLIVVGYVHELAFGEYAGWGGPVGFALVWAGCVLVASGIVLGTRRMRETKRGE